MARSVNEFPNYTFYQSKIARILLSVGWNKTLDKEKSPWIKDSESNSDFSGKFSLNQYNKSSIFLEILVSFNL